MVVNSDLSKVLRREVVKRDDANMWVEAAQIDFNFDGQQDYIVVATAPPLAGANVTKFWIFLAKSSGYELVLSTTALSLEFSTENYNGFRQINTSWATRDEYTTSNYQFAKGKYRLTESETRKIE